MGGREDGRALVIGSLATLDGLSLEEIEALHTRYAEISVPVEIVHGTADTTVGVSIHSEPLAAQVKDAHLTVLDGIGHMPHHSAPEAVVSAINRAATRAGLRPAD